MNPHENRCRDLPGIVASLLAIGVGLMVLHEARDFDTLGAVFPRAVAALMMVFGTIYVLMAVIKPGQPNPALQGSGLRRLAMFGVMLAWALLIEPLGFLTTSLLGYMLALLVANFDRWTARMTMIYCGAGGLVVVGLFVLFRSVLKVPLPAGLLI